LRALVTHPGIQHAHQLAWALQDAGDLVGLWSGIPIQDLREPAEWRTRVFRRYVRTAPVPRRKRRTLEIFPVLRRVAGAFSDRDVAGHLAHRLDHLFDMVVARGISGLRPDLIVCYENSALRTFRAARAAGAVCILDAASVHFEAARNWGHTDPLWIDRQKQEEIALADAVLTCSEFAAETYRAAGVPAAKLYPVPLGTDLPSRSKPLPTVPGRPCRFVFVGSLMRRKAVDLLLDAFEQVHDHGVTASLTLIGGVADTELGDRARSCRGVMHVPFLPQRELFERVAQHDVLVLPSRFDSFGMVVPEAMALGLPALISDRVGAKCIIESHPAAGWIVPCSAEAIRDALARIAGDAAGVLAAGPAAVQAARDFTWAKYRDRVAATIQTIYARYRDSARSRAI
jgi:glycosyltransferase involved in cell wall biosynthesis